MKLKLRVLPAAFAATVLLFCFFFWESARHSPQGATKAKARLLLQEYYDDQQGLSGSLGVVESTFECTKAREIDVVCYFSNVYIWQGSLLFVSADTKRKVPRVAMDFRIASGYFWLRPQVVLPEAVAEARKRARGVVNWMSPQDEVYLFSGTMYNYGHFVGEHLPSIHNSLCKYLGRCAAGNTSGLHLVINRPKAPYIPAYVDDAVQCLAENRLVNMQTPEVKETLIAARRLVVGVGPDCRAADACQRRERWGSKRPISAKGYALYRNHMAQCLGFDAAAPAPTTPKMRFLIVDRHFSSGRHMLNVAQMLEGLRQRYGSTAEVELAYMENTTLAHQARLWAGASVVIHIHGASLGNYAFLPRGAAAVHISLAGRGPAGQGDTFPRDFESDLKGVTDISAVLLHVPFIPNAQLRIREFEKDPLWNNLTGEQRATIMEQGSCRVLGDKHPARKGCAMRWLLKGHDMAVPLPELYEAVDKAVGLVRQKLRLPAPPRPA